MRYTIVDLFLIMIDSRIGRSMTLFDNSMKADFDKASTSLNMDDPTKIDDTTVVWSSLMIRSIWNAREDKNLFVCISMKKKRKNLQCLIFSSRWCFHLFKMHLLLVERSLYILFLNKWESSNKNKKQNESETWCDEYLVFFRSNSKENQFIRRINIPNRWTSFVWQRFDQCRVLLT